MSIWGQGVSDGHGEERGRTLLYLFLVLALVLLEACYLARHISGCLGSQLSDLGM